MPDEGLVLWTDDDCLWPLNAVDRLLDAMAEYRAVEPVVVDLFNRGFSDFTGSERIGVKEGREKPSPARHLYHCGTEPFETEFLSAILLCHACDLKGIWQEVPVSSDTVSTYAIPGPKAIVPEVEVLHMSHTRPQSRWMNWTVPQLIHEGYIEMREKDAPRR